jgi:hypothetical protein
MDDREFIVRFETCTLPEAKFRHADHVRLGWLYLQRLPVLEALDRFAAGLKRFAGSLGKANRYHETITWAYLLLIHERIERGARHADWSQFAAANEDLFDWQDSLLKRYYRKETLTSEVARHVFVFPEAFRQAGVGGKDQLAEGR